MTCRLEENPKDISRKHHKLDRKPATHQQTRSQQVGTSAANPTHDNTLEVLKYRVIGSAIITHFDLGKKSHQKERSAKQKRMYSLMRWKPQSVKSRKHMSHSTVADPNQMPASQEIPGYYLLCPQQYFTKSKFQECMLIISIYTGRE